MSRKTISRVSTLACVLLVAGCQQPPRNWTTWEEQAVDAGADADPQDAAGADALDDGDVPGEADIIDGGDSGLDGDLEEDAGPIDLCEGVFCFPDETCDPATGQCTSEGIDCGEILGCWYGDGLALGSLLTCLLEGSAEGRRDFTDLLTCLTQGCLTEVLGATQDPSALGLCAFSECPTELIPCAGGFF